MEKNGKTPQNSTEISRFSNRTFSSRCKLKNGCPSQQSSHADVFFAIKFRFYTADSDSRAGSRLRQQHSSTAAAAQQQHSSSSSSSSGRQQKKKNFFFIVFFFLQKVNIKKNPPSRALHGRPILYQNIPTRPRVKTFMQKDKRFYQY